LLYSPVDHRDLHSFPTRRSSDLCTAASPKRNFVPRWRGKMPEGQMGAKLAGVSHRNSPARSPRSPAARVLPPQGGGRGFGGEGRSEEHTSELQSRENLVCRLLLE